MLRPAVTAMYRNPFSGLVETRLSFFCPKAVALKVVSTVKKSNKGMLVFNFRSMVLTKLQNKFSNYISLSLLDKIFQIQPKVFNKKLLDNFLSLSMKTTMIKKLFLFQIFITLPLSFLSAQENRLETIVQKGHSASVKAVAMSPDGNFLVTGSRDRTANLWEESTGFEIRTFMSH